jgi:hypothetical protein
MAKTEIPPTDKGRRFLEAICEYGGLTRLQLSILFSPSLAHHNAKKGRLVADTDTKRVVDELIDAEYVQARERSRGANKKHSLVRLTKKGSRYLAQYHGITEKELTCATVDEDKTLDHFIEINDFRIALLRATRDLGQHAELVEFFDEPTLRAMHKDDKVTIKLPSSPRWPEGQTKENVSIVPDYYFHLVINREGRLSHFRRFVEIDRGKEAVRGNKSYADFEEKILKYLEYTDEDGPCKKRYGTTSVSVITVTTKEERLQNLKRVTEVVGGMNRFWFTTRDRLNAKTFFTGKIWQVASKKGLCGFFDNPRGLEDIESQPR